MTPAFLQQADRSEFMKNLRTLVPIDGSANSARTIKALIAMKEELACPLTLLHVFDTERISFIGVQELSLPWSRRGQGGRKTIY